jgi:transcription elongation factor GreA-like protein
MISLVVIHQSYSSCMSRYEANLAVSCGSFLFHTKWANEINKITKLGHHLYIAELEIRGSWQLICVFP